jgi:uncharacterized membrane protein YciS (DUF1049 family)
MRRLFDSLLRVSLLLIFTLISVAFCVGNQAKITLFFPPSSFSVQIPTYFFGALLLTAGITMGMVSAMLYYNRKLIALKRHIRTTKKMDAAAHQQMRAEQVESLGKTRLIERFAHESSS